MNEGTVQKPVEDIAIIAVKQWRVDLDSTLQEMKSAPPSHELALSITKVQEAIMWLGMQLKAFGANNPYPNSYNTANAKIEPTADNLKL